MKYDYLIVGSGLFGSVFAHEANKAGKRVLVIDKRNHLGGNVHTENIEGINVHLYGPHIFHTNDESIWNYVNSFVKFNRYTHSPTAVYEDRVYNLPFNMNTFNQLWGVKTPDEALEIISEQVRKHGYEDPQNLEQQALSLVGKDIYEKLIKGYTEKQWGRSARDLPAFIIKRLPLRYTYDNNYFNDAYQGIPIGGYSKLIEGLLSGIEYKTDTDFFLNRAELESGAEKIIFTGKIDEFYGFKFGKLQYRSLRFEHQVLNIPNYQGNTQVNYTEKKVPYTRIIEHKHFEFGNQDKTIITKEFPLEFDHKNEPFYPINDEVNSKLFKKYKVLADKEDKYIFGGRLAEYKYYDMHQIIASALHKFKKTNG